MNLRRLVALLLLGPCAPVLAADADRELAAALQAMRTGDFANAELHAAAALAYAPDFALAAALQVDVARLKAGLGSRLAGDLDDLADDSERRAWLQWRDEARQRSLALRVGTYAAGLHAVPATIDELLIAETDRSQLHVVTRGADGWRVTVTHYLSIGRRGIGKQRAGDRRTPLGLYWIVDRLEDRQLPARYGPLAFPLDYPNDWDRRKQRRGDGIWLHGTDPATYARPPRDSDGCLVLSDEDLLSVRERIVIGETPVIVARRWSFADRPSASDELPAVRAAIDAWVRAWQRESGERAPSKLAVAELFVADYPSEAGLVMARFRLIADVAGVSRSTRKRLYLALSEAGQWTVVADGSG
ncbi:MAG: L,D-transpeptidase family protein [Pseudomonadota bacterium]